MKAIVNTHILKDCGLLKGDIIEVLSMDDKYQGWYKISHTNLDIYGNTYTNYHLLREENFDIIEEEKDVQNC